MFGSLKSHKLKFISIDFEIVVRVKEHCLPVHQQRGKASNKKKRNKAFTLEIKILNCDLGRAGHLKMSSASGNLPRQF